MFPRVSPQKFSSYPRSANLLILLTPQDGLTPQPTIYELAALLSQVSELYS